MATQLYIRIKYFFWALLPLAFFILATSLHLTIGDFYQLFVDPEYALLYNGIVVGTGSFAINFIDHPATPLIFIIGIAARITHLLTSELPYLQDFLSTPEKYITAANILNNLFIAYILTYAGLKIKKCSGSILLALILQLTIFTHHSILGISSRLIPEASMMIPLILMTALTIKYIYTKEKRSLKPYLWQFPLVIAFGVGCKLSFAPMLLFPFLLLKTNTRQKVNMLLYSILFCCLFAYPLFTNIEASFQWFKDMATHSGQHGSGEMNVVNWSEIPSNFNALFSLDIWFFVFFIFNFVLLFINNFNSKRSKQSIRISRAQSATLITLSIVTLFTLKHFALHYFMPFLIFKGLLVLLTVLSLNELMYVAKGVKRLKALLWSALAIMLLLTAKESIQINRTYDGLNKSHIAANNQQTALLNKMEDKDAALIVDAPYWGSPFKAYAHAYGFMKAHKRKTYFKAELKEKYPNFYWYVGWTDKFNHWDEFVDFEYIFNQNKAVYIYSYHRENFKEIESRLADFMDSGMSISTEILFQKNDSEEKLIYIRLN